MPDDANPRSPFPLGLPIREIAWRGWGLADLAEVADARGRRYALRELAMRAADHLALASPGAPDVAEALAAWRPGELVACALLAEVNRWLLHHYTEAQVPGALGRALAWVDAGRPGAPTAASLAALIDGFPFADTLDELAAARELIGLRLLVENPALAPYRPLFDDVEIADRGAYPAVIDALDAHFTGAAPALGTGMPLFDAMRAAMRAHPHALRDQLRFLRERFGALLPPWLMVELETTGDILAEEEAERGGGPGPPAALRFDDGTLYDGAEERFSADRDWMANVVLVAKSTYVWLDQLSRRFGRPVHRLDAIPDEALDELAGWGFTSLWLIGVWERSRASRTIKQRMGNPEALASAYSLHDYVVAEELGGPAAWAALDARCKARGIRLATDMVPNHTGVDSRWILDHPERFLSLDHPPYPGYRFDGPDLCEHDGVSIRLEDGYWDQSDAAVVFQHVDHRDGGRTRYIYHGNDGTHMPWNDTAQLDYLNPEAREAVIQTILHVARMSHVIRFDAAMTLAKKHVQRLWYPPPGAGGAIPSRAEHALDAAAFERAMPREFWREVVDRVAAEAPDTLLLAEAFWLMEGYFVRTLGMHRVYNSAFMHMLRDEDNARYRETLKNTLAFSAEVLKRFVNFMNNPDEDTAVAQFGKGDKYFGVATLMVTLPGLPMIGHGQVQGFAEKYGMEYRRGYWDETVDRALVARHEREIFPLLRRRHVFSQCDHFALYDVIDDDGRVQEDVFAYSNRAGEERALVIYHNAYREAAGWLRDAAPVRRGGAEAPLESPTLAGALGLGAHEGLVALHDIRGGRWYLRDTGTLRDRGLYVSVGAYRAIVFAEVRLLPDEGLWTELHRRLQGAGVADLVEAYRDLAFAPLRDALARAFEAEVEDDDALVALANVGGAVVETILDRMARVAEATLDDDEEPFARALALLSALPRTLVADAGLCGIVGPATGRDGAAAVLSTLLDVEDPTDARAVLDAARGALGVHTHDGRRWFRKEPAEALLDGWAIALRVAGEPADRAEALRAAVADSGYDWDALLTAVGVQEAELAATRRDVR